MDHSGMDHGGHGGGDMPDMCNMNSQSRAYATRTKCKKLIMHSSPPRAQMLFTWDTNNLCIVFRQWHIRSTAGLVFSLIAVIAIGAGYEALREAIRRYEHRLNSRADAAPRKYTVPLYLDRFLGLSACAPILLCVCVPWLSPGFCFIVPVSLHPSLEPICQACGKTPWFARERGKRAVAKIETRGPVATESDDTETTPFLWTGRDRPEVTKRAHLIKAVLYGIQNFYAFMIMLIFMTYNGWVMISVSMGAFVGYLLFGGSTPATKETACH
ncbi:uncharacterized protein E0L32_011646 [Thyridium curvatum]|uniref:Copper transport protein n=1 Tax=Thyridium curvatum TaxID=1093900 RepID=A0A507BML9_9PEZI|nr:uncharacterized protein E0L32_011646 [Thyridium curvatum]TPX18461.1 hypothetical protein E0L32_011646 [Thyridium curvatum]